MKKIIAIAIVLLLMFAFAACGTETENDQEPSAAVENVAQVVNPITEYDTLEALNEACGSKLAKPALDGITDESFTTISGETYTIAQYRFNVNGNECVLRYASDTAEDISGVYVNGELAFSGVTEGTVNTDTGFVARWFTIDGQYVFCVDNSQDEEWFNTVLDEIKELHAFGDTAKTLAAQYAKMAGEYQDSVSQRACATVVNNNGENITITVNWGSSATEAAKWTMTAVKTEDGLITYKDCKRSVVTYSETGEETETVEYENGEGFFSYTEDGKLLWNGAADENCQNCCFELIPQA